MNGMLFVDVECIRMLLTFLFLVLCVSCIVKFGSFFDFLGFWFLGFWVMASRHGQREAEKEGGTRRRKRSASEAYPLISLLVCGGRGGPLRLNMMNGHFFLFFLFSYLLMYFYCMYIPSVC